MKNLAAILDIGSSKVSALIGERGVNRTFVIKGYAEIPYDGYMQAEFLNLPGLADAISGALDGAFAASRIRPEILYVGVPGEFVSVVTREHRISFPRKRRIRPADVEDLFDSAYPRADGDKTVINRSGIYFILDDNRRVARPEGEISDRLGGVLSFLLADGYFTGAIGGILRQKGFSRVEYVAESLAEGLFLFAPEVRDRMAILADVGYLSTAVSVVCGDGILAQSAFSFGGGHLSAMLAGEFDLDFRVAELLSKSVNLSRRTEQGDVYELSLDEKDYAFDALRANATVTEGLDEICEKISAALDGAGVELPEYIPVSLTGGGISHMRGAKEYLARRLGRVVEIVRPALPHMNVPARSSELGLLDLALGDSGGRKSWLKRIFG